jgi:hypothetical protein
MARVVFLHKLPTAFVVVGRGFSGNGHGERRIIPYQLFGDRTGMRPLNVGLFENEAAAESYCAKQGWTMQLVDLDADAIIRVVPGGKVKVKSVTKIGWTCSVCDCINTKRPGFRHIDSWRRKVKTGLGKLDAKKQAIRDGLPHDASGFVCTSCFHMDRLHRVTLDAK